MIEKTVSELARALSTGSVSSVELTQAFIDRITSIDTQQNSYITVDEETALRQARQADDARSRGTDTLLLGIPIAHKDLFCTQGTKTTCGSKMLKDFVSPYDATVVARLKDSGAVTLGKTNCDEFAMGSSNENSFLVLPAILGDRIESPEAHPAAQRQPLRRIYVQWQQEPTLEDQFASLPHSAASRA